MDPLYRRCILLLADGARPDVFDLRDRYEHPEHRGSHGSLHRDHMLVPLLTNHPIPSPLRTADIFPTILKLMGKPIPSNHRR